MTMAQAMGAEMDFAVEDENNAYMKDWVDSYLKPNLSATKVCYNTNGCWNKGSTKLKDGAVVPAYSDSSKDKIESDCSNTGSGRACILKYLKQ